MENERRGNYNWFWEGENLADFYRFKGYSLTPRIKNENEIVLSRDKAACTFTADQDVTLYAQWDTSFRVAYIGNGQSEGENRIDETGDLTEKYTFRANHFCKTVQKEVKDIASGQMQDESGKPYMETVPYSFQGFSMVKEADEQKKYAVYQKEDGGYEQNSFYQEKKLQKAKWVQELLMERRRRIMAISSKTIH